MRLIAAPGALRDVELEVLGWRVDDGETMLTCRLIDGSVGRVPARWTDLPRRGARRADAGGAGIARRVASVR